MRLKDLIELKKEGKNVAETLDNLFKNSEETKDLAGLEIGAVYDNAISYDYDFEELMKLLEIKKETRIENREDINIDSDFEHYIYFSDGTSHIVVPYIRETNRHDDTLGDEEFMFFNEMEEIDVF